MAKVAFLSFYSGVVDRGVETFVHEVARRLAKNHNICVYQSGPIKPQAYKSIRIKSKAGQPKQTDGLLSKLYLNAESLKIFLFTLKVIPDLSRAKYDVIVPTNGGWQMVLLRIFSKLTGSKLLVSGHAGVGADDAWNIYTRPDIFIALTTAQEKWAKKLAPEMKVAYIPNGVDLANFHPKVKPAQVNLPKPIAICVSALVPYKRIDLTIKAVAKTKLSLLLLGDGQLKGQLDSLGKRLLGNRYLRLVVPYEEMPSYYRAAQVFTLASITEAFGISYLEAMACNLPVVTTNDASRAEIIGKAGNLTEPTNIDKYAKDLQTAAITSYRNIPYDQSLSFSWNKVAKKYADVIKNLVHD